MSKCKDSAKINFMQFIEVFLGLLQTYPRDMPNKTVFNLLDTKNEGQLSIMFLMNIFNNMDRETLFV